MKRRTVIGVLALAGIGGYFVREDGSAVEGDDRTDTGGLIGFRHLEQMEWGDYGDLTLVFSDEHGSDFFTISHESNADDGDNYIILHESPDFGGEVTLDFGEAVENDGRDFPSREFAIDYYKGDDLGVVAAVDEHLGTDTFDVPEGVHLTGGRTIGG